jgi:hypothetical protein
MPVERVMPFGKSDLLASITSLIALGAGAYLGSLTPGVERIIGGALFVGGIAAFVYWFGYYRKEPAETPTIGDNNTVVGGGVPKSMGSGNTFVGATDSRGNTIIRGGTAIGAGARADGTSVIGTKANARRQS